MARAVNIKHANAESLLALAQYHNGNLTPQAAQAKVEELALFKEPAYLYIAQLWHAFGNTQNATHFVLKAYEDAWDVGEPYVYRYELEQSVKLLNELEQAIPVLEPYNESKNQKLPFEDDLMAAIEELKQQKPQEKKRN